MAKKSQQIYLAKLRKEFDVALTEENYKDLILEEVGSPPALLDYLRDYMEKNEPTLEWGCLMFLFIRADEEKYVSDIERYYKLLERYPPNCFIEVGMAELQLRYYGDIFKARNGFFKGLELRPDDAYCHYNLGFIHHLLGVFDKSCAHYEKAVINHQIANKPKELKARALYNLAVIKINRERDYEEAEMLLKESLAAMPQYPEAKRALKQIMQWK